LSFAASFLVKDTSPLTSRITLNRLDVAVSRYAVQFTTNILFWLLL